MVERTDNSDESLHLEVRITIFFPRELPASLNLNGKSLWSSTAFSHIMLLQVWWPYALILVEAAKLKIWRLSLVTVKFLSSRHWIYHYILSPNYVPYLEKLKEWISRVKSKIHQVMIREFHDMHHEDLGTKMQSIQSTNFTMCTFNFLHKTWKTRDYVTLNILIHINIITRYSCQLQEIFLLIIHAGNKLTCRNIKDLPEQLKQLVSCDRPFPTFILVFIDKNSLN